MLSRFNVTTISKTKLKCRKSHLCSKYLHSTFPKQGILLQAAIFVVTLSRLKALATCDSTFESSKVSANAIANPGRLSVPCMGTNLVILG